MTGRNMFGMLVAVIVLILVMGTVAMFVVNKAQQSRADLPVIAQIGEFEFVDQDGELFIQEDMLGNVSVVAFMFTRCPGACPVMAGYLDEIYEVYKAVPNVQIVSVSVDPEYDDPETVKAYLLERGVETDTWMYLTGPLEDVVEVCEQQFLLAAEELPGGHSTRFALVDHRGQIRGYYDGMERGSVEVLKTHLPILAGQIP
jgi:protein SCO1